MNNFIKEVWLATEDRMIPNKGFIIEGRLFKSRELAADYLEQTCFMTEEESAHYLAMLAKTAKIMQKEGV